MNLSIHSCSQRNRTHHYCRYRYRCSPSPILQDYTPKFIWFTLQDIGHSTNTFQIQIDSLLIVTHPNLKLDFKKTEKKSLFLKFFFFWGGGVVSLSFVVNQICIKERCYTKICRLGPSNSPEVIWIILIIFQILVLDILVLLLAGLFLVLFLALQLCP